MPVSANLPVIPYYITVHLGKPNSNAANKTVLFTDYIKNVASSEIYPTWPDSSLRSNIYAIISYTLNRIYTEHYRSRGYDFDITNSTSYDQAYVPGREIYSNIEKIVDELFNDYVIRNGQVQPLFTQYCNGTSTTCNGLSQWGSVAYANQGFTPYQILQRSFGNNISIVSNAPVNNIPQSYRGPLRFGSISEDVRTIQRELNRISANYPSIPKIPEITGVFDKATENAVKKFQSIFGLTPDGIVGKDTWYKIKQIYNGIKKVSEIYSEGITLSEVERIAPQFLQRGDRSNAVKSIQILLRLISQFDDEIPVIAADGIFGPITERAVIAFQKKYGLTPDGKIGRATINKINAVYNATLNALPDEYKTYSSLLYPGYNLTIGSSGKAVEQIQTYLRTIAQNDSRVPMVTVDGIYGPQTAAAVKAVQSISGIQNTPAVGPLTWNAIVNLYNDYR